MPGRVVAGQPPAQVAVQRDGVQQRLQRIVGVLHLGHEGGGPVVPGRRAARRRRRASWSCSRRWRTAVRRRQRAAPGRGCRPDSRAASRSQGRVVRAGRRSRPGVAGGQSAPQQVGDGAGRARSPRGVSPPASGSSKLQLVEPVGPADVAQADVGDQRAERRLDGGPQPGDDARRDRRCRRGGGRSSRPIAAASSASRSVAAKSVASSTRCMNVPTRAPPGMSRQERAATSAAPPPASVTLVGCGRRRRPAPRSSVIDAAPPARCATRASWVAALVMPL